ncbi:MAG TPA: hypothetical protein VN817_04255, partial [Solirubrobacteraceae bacterium]|nr:hypothetical protein [Solirubrobacteraceae bacterium]
MGKRNRKKQRSGAGMDGADLRAPSSDYTDADGNVLTLRGSLTPAARREYAETLSGSSARAAATQDDAWQRAVELL